MSFIDKLHSDVFDKLRESGELSDDMVAKLKKTHEDFKKLKTKEAKSI
jgi:hypothetical protein